MKDTPNEIMIIQHEIFFTKSLEQRFLLAMQMIDDGVSLCRASIKNEQPNISEKELKVELFKKIYSTDFSEYEFQKISLHLNNH